MIFDSHAHYDDEAFEKDREELLKSLPEKGVSPVVNVAAQLSGVTTTVELTEKYPFVYGSVGVHPDHVGELTEEKIQWMKELAGRERSWLSEKSVWITTGIRNRMNCRESGSSASWSLPKR